MTTSTPLPYDQVAYPAAPWQMRGSMWLTVLRLPHDVDTLRPRGIYGAAWVRYEEGSPLTYDELLVARAAPGSGGREVTITDIWVDSPASVAGGRELWAIPKGLCSFDPGFSTSGPLARSSWSAATPSRPIASARFTDVARFAPRVPFRGLTTQPGLPEGGGPKSAALRGTARVAPARAAWRFAPDGPLGWLADARPLASVRMAGFRMSFG